MEKTTKENKKGIQILIILSIIVLIIVICLDIVINYAPIEEIFGNKVKTITSKEVTVTDEGIADAVDKLYDATVIVEVGSEDKLTGWGSGFVYKKDEKFAYILTNHHVIDEAKEIEVVFTDESSAKAALIGSDEYMDVAVLKVDASKVKAVAEIGASEKMRLGDTVFAIGTPVNLNYAFTVTRGILSGTNRFVSMSSNSSSGNYSFSPFGQIQPQQSEVWVMSLLQIDASINSGNSGGPLANANGEVIGITNSKISGSTMSSANIENIGFAIPIEDALNIADQLIENGKVSRPVIGVSLTTIEGASYNGIELDEDTVTGAVVTDVVSGGLAEGAGLKKGDVITKVDDYRVSDYKYFKYYLYRYHLGDTIKITYVRNGKTLTTNIKLK